MHTQSLARSKTTRQFPHFDLEHLLRTIFHPARGEKVCILIDLDHPEDVVDFSFLQNVDLAIPRKAYASFYRELTNGMMQHMGLGGCDFYAYASTGGHNRDFPAAVIAPDGTMYSLEKDIFPSYDIFLCITTYEATLPLTAAAKKHNFRGAAMHGLNYTILRTGLAVDYDDVHRQTEILRQTMTKANTMEIEFAIEPLHYRLELDLGGAEAEKCDGLCHSSPSIVNLPSGEVFFSIKDASGSFPIQFEDGTLALCQVDRKKIHTVILIRGDKHITDEWQRKIKRDPSSGALAKISFGTQALPYSGSPIQDEKILGTFHLTLGRKEMSSFLFSPDYTPDILVRHVYRLRDGKKEPVFENYQPISSTKMTASC